MASLQVGDKITTHAKFDCDGNSLHEVFRNNSYYVVSIDGSRIGIGNNGKVLATVHIDDTIPLSSSSSSIKPVNTPTIESVSYNEHTYSSPVADGDVLDSDLSSLMRINTREDIKEEEILKYNMRLFGIPHQYTQYCDYRTYSSEGSSPVLTIGRKFIENIMLEAPVVTLVPGKPLYLPAAKNTKGLTYGLLQAANNNLSVLLSALQDEGNIHEKLRYYDFQQDYYTYMKYVNILCSVSAAFLDLDEDTIDGIPLTEYDWKNYRWNETGYSMAVENIFRGGLSAATKGFERAKLAYQEVIKGESPKKKGKIRQAVDGFVEGVANGVEKMFEDDDDKDTLAELEDVLKQLNFVQFYANPSSGSQSHSNETSQSKMAGVFDMIDDLGKELAFIMNSGGADIDLINKAIEGGTDELSSRLLSSKHTGGIRTLTGRLLSSGSNVLKGENMIFPQIYQNSSYTNNYDIVVDLRAPYGNKVSYFINVLVPLYHLIAFAIPKQTTANTYGSPFLLRAYMPGTFVCNLGIVNTLNIEKNPSGDSWTVDGYPSEIKVTMSITDLYSDLTMTPAGANSLQLFLANSSLVEYLATNCGVNMVTPQLANKVKYMVTAVKSALKIVDDEVADSIFGYLENTIRSLVRI